MAISPESSHHKPTDFRAPPPSPVAAGRRSTAVANDDVLAEFLEHSLRVPELILPDRVFPRLKSIQNPPKLDLDSLNSSESGTVVQVLDSIRRVGCFQLANHGISGELIGSVMETGAGIFKLLPEKKAAVSRSGDRSYGFVEFHCESDQAEEERETSEEFVWCRDEALKLEMEGIWPTEYSNFSEKMEILMSEIEKVARSFLRVLQENTLQDIDKYTSPIHEKDRVESICYLYKHCRDPIVPMDDHYVHSLRYDVIRMLIRGSEHSHALCFHLCNGSSEFHVYSKKGWVSFHPDKDALVITIGDQLQAWSCGKYKHMIGRPVFKCSEAEYQDQKSCISISIPIPMIFDLHHHPCPSDTMETTIDRIENKPRETIISLGQQALFALVVILFYHAFVYFYRTN